MSSAHPLTPSTDPLDQGHASARRDLAGMSLDLLSVQKAYAQGWTLSDLIAEVLHRIGDDPHRAWIQIANEATLHAQVTALQHKDPAQLPLYGVPFAVKDNIDVAGMPTTAACPAYAYTPTSHAHVVQRLIDAGAIVIGKTNLDQFATGLNGTRSPYGACRNAFDADYISGGSSSGSAVATALGHVSFALGTDTAGSGRVPAAFNHLIGLKPTCGLLSTTGVVPACRSLDTVSVFALTAHDAHRVFKAALGTDAADPYSRAAQPHGFDFGTAARWRLGVPRSDQLDFKGEAAYAAGFEQAIAHARALGAEIVPIDFAPFKEAAALLYGGPWVAERYQAIRAFIDAKPEALWPVTREITQAGAKPLAADVFAAQYKLRALQQRARIVWQDIDALLTPTAPTHYTIEQMLASPIERNSDLGLYTNFMNLLDCAAVAVPMSFTQQGLPFGVTLAAPAHQDVPLLHLARRWQAALKGRAATLGATGASQPDAAPIPAAVQSGQVRVAVCGAHLQGQPLNHQLTSRGARLVACTHSAPHYKLYALASHGVAVKRPGMVRVGANETGGRPIEVEVWEMPSRHFGSFVAGIPAPLGIGTTVLADGSTVPGFICEPYGLEGAADITSFGGWRAWLASMG